MRYIVSIQNTATKQEISKDFQNWFDAKDYLTLATSKPSVYRAVASKSGEEFAIDYRVTTLSNGRRIVKALEFDLAHSPSE